MDCWRLPIWLRMKISGALMPTKAPPRDTANFTSSGCVVCQMKKAQTVVARNIVMGMIRRKNRKPISACGPR